MRFTFEDALEAQEDGEPIMVSYLAAQKICSDHHARLWDFDAHAPATRDKWECDAADLLLWLGY